MVKILCIDDESDVRETYTRKLRKKYEKSFTENKYMIFKEISIEQTLEKIRKMRGLDIAFIDMHLENTSGIEYIKPLKKEYPDVYIVLTTNSLAAVLNKIEEFESFKDVDVLEKNYVLDNLEGLIEGGRVKNINNNFYRKNIDE